MRFNEHYKCVAVSTGVMTEDDRFNITNGANENMVMVRDTGFFMKLYENDEGALDRQIAELSDALQDLIRAAYDQGNRLIEFDADAPWPQLGVSAGNPTLDSTLIASALAHISQFFERGSQMTNSELTRQYLQLKTALISQEMFGVIFLDTQHRVIADEVLFKGTVDGVPVYPREIIKTALQYEASAVILYHNHPSGSCEPSPADESLTQRIRAALNMVDIRLIDHMVVGKSGSVSFAERGMI